MDITQDVADKIEQAYDILFGLMYAQKNDIDFPIESDIDELTDAIRYLLMARYTLLKSCE